MAYKNPESKKAYQKEYYRKNRKHYLEYSHSRYRKNRELMRAQSRERYLKRRAKDLEGYRHKHKLNARKWRLAHPNARKEYYRKHVKENTEYMRKYRMSHPEFYTRLREYMKKHRAHFTEKARKWRSKNKDKRRASDKKYRETHLEEVKERFRNYIKAHPEVAIKHVYKRRARKANTICDLTAREIRQIKQNGCFFCGSRLHLTIAHDIPVSQHGNTNWANCFCLCRSCNSKMHTRKLAEMLVQLELFPSLT